jgi:uncharacterized SAM-binding protein YcdF (DUF218 family)
MMIYLHKILPFFFLPLGVISVLIAVGAISRRRRWCLAGLGLLWVCAIPAASDQLMRAVEGRAMRMPAAAMPEADVIVVLSSRRIRAPGDAGVIEWQDPDRVLGGIALFHAGKAPFLFFPNGKMPWDSDANAVGPLSMQFAQKMGVPKASMDTTEKVMNTAQEARAIAERLKKRKETAFPPKVLLVTSAYHMRRSTLLFEREGLEVIPFPVDFQVEAGNKRTFLDLMPQAGALRQTEKALREIYGFLFYWVLSD